MLRCAIGPLPGFAHVFAATAQNCYEQWTRNRPEAIRLVDQNISSPVARVAVRYMMHRLSGILQEEAERFGPIPAALRHLAAVR